MFQAYKGLHWEALLQLVLLDLFLHITAFGFKGLEIPEFDNSLLIQFLPMVRYILD